MERVLAAVTPSTTAIPMTEILAASALAPSAPCATKGSEPECPCVDETVVKDTCDPTSGAGGFKG